ncbi:Nif11-like leader peptide family natural product precursor [Synechococcus lacustris]|uniref:Nif11-like leader peptide family natural product precursor n=1 Tax=Synechococcus lacustris TaxID=2116544 RepID=UPI0020CDD9BC|nr:Nif11-like leader peptide family natural product precursor [Synechococcus lacustris]MCP9795840.1 Nif11-like leader peptide family natural product precursor [Synechococcus lacustris L1F-Slac]
MSLVDLKAFMALLQQDEIKKLVLSASTADDVALIGKRYGLEFSGDELLRISGQKFDRVTVHKNTIPGEYN